MSDQDKISSWNINAESSGKVRRLKNKTQLEDYKLIQSPILLIEIISILWPTLGRIADEILRVKGLKYKRIALTWNYQPFTCDNCLLSTSNWSEFWPFKRTVWLESHNPLISLSDMHSRLLSQWDQEVQREKGYWRTNSFQFQLTKNKLGLYNSNQLYNSEPLADGRNSWNQPAAYCLLWSILCVIQGFPALRKL